MVKEKKEFWLGLGLILVVWVILRLPNIDAEMGLKMDAASTAVTWFIDESFENDPWSRLGLAVDHRHQWEELEKGDLRTYLHVPPLALWPLGFGVQWVGKSEVALRGLGIFFSLVLAGAMALWLREMLGWKEALCGVGIMGLMAHTLHYGRNVDPMVTHAIWLPLLAWTYERYRKHETSGYFVTWMLVGFLSMMSYWSSYGVFGLMGLYHVLVRKRNDLKVWLGTPLIMAVSLGLTLLWFSLAVGGWDHLVHDFEESLGARTGDGVMLHELILGEAQRWLINVSIVFPFVLGISIWLLKGKASKEIVFIWVLLLASLAFPLFAGRTTWVHDYFTYWSIPPLCAMAIIVGKELWFSHKGWIKWALVLVLLIHLGLNAKVAFNRMVKYDKDYLLSRDLGKFCREHVPDKVILTNNRDILHVFQYYSQAKTFLCVDHVEALETALEKYDLSGRKEGLVFVTLTPDDLLKRVPALKSYPREKLTQEFSLEDENGPLLRHLRKTFPVERIHDVLIFSLR